MEKSACRFIASKLTAMMKYALLLAPFLLLGCFFEGNNGEIPNAGTHSLIYYSSIAAIPLPAGYTRIPQPPGSFGAWLRSISLKKDNRVHLYNGQLKKNQDAQFAVLDMPVGNQDLQQCADAVMRLRAEYLLAEQKYDSIVFLSTSGQSLRFADWRRGVRYRVKGNRLVNYKIAVERESLRQQLDAFLPFVFMYAGTLSLEHQMKKRSGMSRLIPGDVFVRGGSPGHAMIVTDVAVNKEGKKIFMLAQSYMPAQDIHVVKNPLHQAADPWYEASEMERLITPEWTFATNQLYHW